jgi:UMF1 family MFS transporter
VWWALWTVIPLLGLRNRPPAGGEPAAAGGASSFRQFARTLAGMRAYPTALTFLIAYLLYNDAVQAVIALSGQFAADELRMPMSQLTIAILMVQFLAVGGSLLFGRIAAAIGAKSAIVVSLLIWIATVVAIYLWVRTATHFFVMAAVVAIVLGGTQALSRSLFSQFIPRGKEAEYFSLYEISDKGTSWLAPLIFALALQFTGSYRIAILSLLVFFVSGLLVLLRVDVRGYGADKSSV